MKVMSETPQVNEAWRINRQGRFLETIILFASGVLMTASLPSINCGVAAWAALVPLYWIAREQSLLRAGISGWVWGFGWSLTAFFWLREINPVIPFLIAPVLGLYTAVWAMAIPVFRRGILIPVKVQLDGFEYISTYHDFSPLREVVAAIALASWWCVIEWLRSGVLPWNYLSVSQWRNLSLLQIVEFTGTYGISFLIVWFNVALAMALEAEVRAYRGYGVRRCPWPLLIVLAVVLAVAGCGAMLRENLFGKNTDAVSFKAGLIQGNIPQCRMATSQQAEEALDVYIGLSEELARRKPDFIIWPETAVPYPYWGRNSICSAYRYRLDALIGSVGIPFLIGTIDYEKYPRGINKEPGTLNSAFLFDAQGKMREKYDKIQLVPFGEYVPFRKYMPQWMINIIDMHRDLSSGVSFAPLEVLPDVKAGMSICFEDIFSYVSREEALLGANMLLVITNDAWYPVSYEPEQHLANAVLRTIETRLPMLRCGNNGASCLIQPDGRISNCLLEKDTGGKTVPAPELRGRRIGIIQVSVPRRPELTFYTRHGDVFLFCCAVFAVTAMLYSLWTWREKKLTLSEVFK